MLTHCLLTLPRPHAFARDHTRGMCGAGGGVPVIGTLPSLSPPYPAVARPLSRRVIGGFVFESGWEGGGTHSALQYSAFLMGTDETGGESFLSVTRHSHP